MKAVVYKEPYKVAVETVDDPLIEAPGDVIVKITTAAICGSDLHMYDGRTGAKPNTVIGHENMGVVETVGPGVTSIKKGDRVVLPFNIACGFCFNCLRGFTSDCLTANAQGPHAAYGYVDMGPFKGGQAEYLRVPYGDFNCLKLPGTPFDEMEDDFVMLADIWPTGYHAAELAQVRPGGTVAVFGAGPVGLMAVLSAVIKGASVVYCVDGDAPRLKLAELAGATPINTNDGDPVAQIEQMRKSNMNIQNSLRPGEEKLTGVTHGVDAVGYQARGDADPRTEKPTQVLEDLIRLVNPTGYIGIVGVYNANDPGAADEKAKKGLFELPFGAAFGKGLSIGMGQAPVKRYNEYLRDLIVMGRAKPSFIVSHRLPLEGAPEAYKRFDERGGEYTKVLLKPSLAGAGA